MSFISNIIKKYIKKLLVHQARKYEHELNEIDIITRYHNGDVILMTYSLRYRSVLNTLSEKEVEYILKN